MHDRKTEGYEKTVYDFINFVEVICPKCGGNAVVTSGEFTLENFLFEEVKAVCTNCGLNKKLKDSVKKNEELSITVGEPFDPFFKLPLRLKIDVEDKILWAYNFEHLNFLYEFINADLRERNIAGMKNNSLGSRLPKWMTASKNRHKIIKAIQKLLKSTNK